MISAGVAVAWSGASKLAPDWEIEFHLSTNKTQDIHTSHVIFILFRVTPHPQPEALFIRGADGIKALDEALLHLPHLAKVVLETFDLNDSAAFASGMVHMANKIYRQTCQQSRELALNEELPVEDGDQVVVSPRWYPSNGPRLGRPDVFW